MWIVSCALGNAMPQTMRAPDVTTPDSTHVTPRPKPAKAELRDKDLQPQLSSVVLEAARKAHGKQEAAARELEKDPGNFSRDVKAGRTTLRDCADLGGAFLAILGQELVNEFGAQMESPKERARQRLPELIREILEATK